ncbi:DUF305 domain-containing protein [Nonomuraea angiospora]|uniref:Uncharacterized protein (DUF305 family) n=1 Tax=Nonomuraea angiospora TaxID=46172 RepID=A0ABR9LVC7_9ACTN|nr:DUF305 domain-containing protein [Nonomuraea angiospora]MBE1584275.1 uncharacterized protein (DUF305 family) [Nonomuraea angiospora]
MFTNMRIPAATAAAGAVLALVAGCGGAGSGSTGPDMAGMSSSAPAATTASASPAAAFNDADVMFAQMMIPHHQQAVEMADLAGTRAADKEVKELAAKIKAAQDPEIQTMKGWLTAWGKPMPSEGMDHGMGHDMPGMMSEDDMKKLEAAKGGAFDRQFAELMIAHHNGAIEMARTEQAQGSNAEAKELAKTIETAQQAEVAQLREILDRL